MEYKNDLEKAYQLYEFPLDKKDLEWLFYEGYDRMKAEHESRPPPEPRVVPVNEDGIAEISSVQFTGIHLCDASPTGDAELAEVDAVMSGENFEIDWEEYD